MNNKIKTKRKVILHNLIKEIILLFVTHNLFFFFFGANRIQTLRSIIK